MNVKPSGDPLLDGGHAQSAHRFSIVQPTLAHDARLALGGLAAARALQGVFGALLAPASLSILTTTFTDPQERGKAFGVFGAVAVGGAAIGLILGGVLTQYLNWRWCLYVNLAFAIPAALAAMPLLHNEIAAHRPRIDVPGAVTATAGLFAIVYGLANSETNGWADPVTIGMLVASVVLLAAFVVIQTRSANPLLPLRVVLDRDRGGSFLAMVLTGYVGQLRLGQELPGRPQVGLEVGGPALRRAGQQRPRVRLRLAHVLWPEPPIEADRGVQAPERRILAGTQAVDTPVAAATTVQPESGSEN